MSNLRVIYDNAADRATLSSSATQGNLGVSNLLSDVKSKVCRSNSKSLSVYATWPNLETVGCVANAFTNLSPTATARIRLTNEASTTNLLKYTENLQSTNPGWYSYYGIDSIPDVTTAPDGTLSADGIYPMAGAGVTGTAMYAPGVAAATVGTTYTFSVFVKAGSVTSARIGVGTSGALFNAKVFNLLDAASSNGSNWQQTLIGNGWWRLSVQYTATGTGALYCSVGFSTNLAAAAFPSSYLYVWGAQFEVGSVATSYYPSVDTFTSRSSSIATYIASDGTMQIAGANVARYSYNPSNLSAAPQLLVEPAATNLVTASGAFTTGWTGNVSVTASIYSYRGIESYKYLAKTTTSTSEQKTISLGAVAAGGYLTATIALRAGTVTSTGVGLYDGAGTLWGANADSMCAILEGPGTVAQQAGGLFNISNLSPTVDTVVQITRAYNTAATNASLAIYPGTSADTTIGHSILATRVQVEAGKYPTSYIPTGATTVTRAADVWSSNPGTRPLGYIDTWQSYTYDSGTILFSPAPYKIYHGMTQSQAASAYAYGGGKYGCAWIPKLAAYGMAIDIVDTNNLQGYVEVSKLICGDYWAPSGPVDVQNTSLQVVDTSSHTRTDAGDLYTYVGTKHRKQTINLPSIESTSRKQLWDIMWGNGISKPMFISLYPNNADASLEAAHMLYGKLASTPIMSTPYYNFNAATVEIEEV